MSIIDFRNTVVERKQDLKTVAFKIRSIWRIMQLGLVLGLHTAAGFRQGILEEVDYADGIDLLG